MEEKLKVLEDKIDKLFKSNDIIIKGVKEIKEKQLDILNVLSNFIYMLDDDIYTLKKNL